MNALRPQEPSSTPLRLGVPSGGLPPGGQIRRLGLAGTSGTVGRARAFAREALEDWQWLPGQTEEQTAVAEDVLLLVSELVTNACLHAGGPTELALHGTARTLRVEVSDAGEGAPVPRVPHEPGRPGGHGLHIVERLASAWGTVRQDGGKTVWLEVPAPLSATVPAPGR
ncbi:ATP-binding protein [Streptacidiphilus sp. N1-12]|uniref:ATP-binding protein n=2 Tax=Streptacidiphilus alkalitolerans TaxID=3342712 RepID=A0ABV6WAG5_9ACTN